jgi:hypothetical protein
MLHDFKDIICVINDDEQKIVWRVDDSNFETYNCLKQETELLNKEIGRASVGKEC